MNIAIDMRRRAGFGAGTYIRNVLRTLGRLDPPQGGGADKEAAGNKYVLIGSPDRLREFRDLPENFILQPFPGTATSIRSAIAFRNMVKRHKADVLHVPHLFKTPRFSPCPYVITVHDVVDFLYRRSDQTETQSRMRFLMGRMALRGAARILAVSRSTSKDLQRVFGLSDADIKKKVRVTYNAIDERFLQGHASEADRKFIAERYQVNHPFLLYVGNVKPHKNVSRLIEAFSALKSELAKTGDFPDLKLIIIGDDVSSHPDLRRTVIRSGVQGDVRFLGFVPIEALRIFYDVAKIFAFPSRYEGFGLPPLEAMSHGTPVVTSNTSSLPEVVGDAAVLVNPDNSFEIMHALHRVLLDKPLREVLKRRGYERAQHFSWESSVRELLQAYQEAATGTTAGRKANNSAS